MGGRPDLPQPVIPPIIREIEVHPSSDPDDAVSDRITRPRIAITLVTRVASGRR